MKRFWIINNEKRIRAGSAGFTLMEVIAILVIMGFFAAMMVPSIGHLNKNHRIKLTAQKLESIRTAILGPQNIFNNHGLRAVGGYVGDMDELPVLYKAQWNKEEERWDWVMTGEDYAEFNFGYDGSIPDAPCIGQPRGLWNKMDTGGMWALWKGPYLLYPRAQYNNRDKEVSPLLKTEGLLADAWGRALFFIKEGTGKDTNLLIISAGPDGKITTPDLGDPTISYDENGAGNDDNICIEISPAEWYSPNLNLEEQKTQEILNRIRIALIGPPDAFDPSGRRIIGGYTGDMGEWPKLYEWDETNAKWQEASDPTANDVCMQPRGLWISDPDGDGNDDLSAADNNGFAWRGPYLLEPWGEGEDEVLRDAWGTPLKFQITGGDLSVISAGRDQVFAGGGSDPGDDIPENGMIIEKGQWLVEDMAVHGRVINNSGGEIAAGSVTVRLWKNTAENVSITNSEVILEGGCWDFELPATEIPGGKRWIEIVSPAQKRPVFIGRGRTQSPLEDNLIFIID